MPRPPVHGGGRGGGDAVALALAHVHIILAGPHQLLALGVLLLGGIINIMTLINYDKITLHYMTVDDRIRG